ncbi:putative histone-like transcription factor [Heterostelium album PN500]|uniref:Putative histone-like transcription factor n=1 Tax=Heterostelium pallidum (strain ATCC 26659 / Pp 5 / PN500) TaxID=670386 RepID=D3BPA6_HETP5|nr:putative histone-like transcription factor [Heterostelium album PN500]EFA77116.1 putative histone-like transcription factor [Heterostelium album PN500]|eukprot:XP_020429245.1 putative histone-like transcription factor [Heterostelium album PN500]
MESAASATLGNKVKQLHINTNYSPLFNSSSISQQHSPVSLLPPSLSTEHPPQQAYSSPFPENQSMMQPISFLGSPGSFPSPHHHHGLANPPIPPYPKPGNSFIVENKLFSPTIPTPNLSSPQPQTTQTNQQTSHYHKQLHQHLENKLSQFWRNQIKDISKMEDFKTTHELPLARIKKIMKSDEEVNKISAEVPMLFSKACELFILEITLRSWVHTEMNKRRTLQRIDIANALSRSDVFDFLIDIVPRDEMRGPRLDRKLLDEMHRGNYNPDFLQYYQIQQMADNQAGIKRSYSMEITPSNSEQISPSSSPKKRSLSHDFSNGENGGPTVGQPTSYMFENSNSSSMHGLHHIVDHHNMLPPSPSYNIPSILNYSNQNIYQPGATTGNGNLNANHEILHHNNSSQPHHHHFSNSSNHSNELNPNAHQFHQYYFHDEHGK